MRNLLDTPINIPTILGGYPGLYTCVRGVHQPTLLRQCTQPPSKRETILHHRYAQLTGHPCQYPNDPRWLSRVVRMCDGRSSTYPATANAPNPPVGGKLSCITDMHNLLDTPINIPTIIGGYTGLYTCVTGVHQPALLPPIHLTPQ